MPEESHGFLVGETTGKHALTSDVHVFDGGTTNFMRADGTWAAPPSGQGGTPSGTVVSETAYAAGSTAGTSAEYSRGDHSHGSPADLVTGTAHAALATGVHGAGTATIATTADITTHAALTTVHSLGPASTAASTYYATTTNFAAHTASATSHGAGTIAGLADITSHAALTTVHSLGPASTAASTYYATTANFAAHTASATSHGAGTIAGLADVTNHAALTSVHSLGPASTAASTYFATATSLGTASTAASAAYALTTTYAAHTTDTAAHLGGAGTVASSAAVTALITTHANSILGTATHGRAFFTSGTVVMTGSAMTDITGLVASAGTTNSTYRFIASVSNSCSLTAGVQFSFGYTGSNATVEGQVAGRTFAGSADHCGMTAFATKSGVVFNRVAATAGILLTGVVTTAGTIGNFSIQHCSGSATGTITARAKSYLEWSRIA